MTLTEYLDAIAEKLGVTNLPDRLLTTYLEAFAKKDGVDVSTLPDRLASTYLNAILKVKGVQPVKDNLLTTQLAALAGAYGATDLPGGLVSTYLNAIIGGSSGFNGVITEVLLAEQSIEAITNYEGTNYVDLSDVMPNCNMQVGQTFVVTVDGVSYRCVSWDMYGEPRIGDSRLVPDYLYEEYGNTNPEDVPFLIDYYAEWDDWTQEETIYAGVTFSNPGIHTLKIEREIVIPKTEFTITGDEPFTFQSANNTVYYKNSDFINIPHDNIVHAECTHFEWGDGAVIADMKDGQFIFNYTKSSGIGTGNISFKRDDLFTSASVAKEWFREQVANGTPVTITVYVKE